MPVDAMQMPVAAAALAGSCRVAALEGGQLPLQPLHLFPRQRHTALCLPRRPAHTDRKSFTSSTQERAPLGFAGP